jgi:hypothetical protein
VFLIYFVAGESLSSKSPRPTPVAIAQLIGKHTKRSQWVLVGLSLFFSIPEKHPLTQHRSPLISVPQSEAGWHSFR